MGSGLPRRQFAAVFAALFVTAAGNTALQSVLPVIGRELGVDDLLIALVFSLSALLWTFSAPYWAQQSDVRGRRKLMQVGVAGFGGSMLLCATIIHMGLAGVLAGTWTVILFVVARSIFGVFGSAASPASQAYVAGRTSEAERTNALATLASAFGLGTIIGPAVAPFFVLPVVGLAGPMFAFTGVAVVVFAALAKLLPDDDPAHRSAGRGAAGAMPSVGGIGAGASVTAADAASRGGTRKRMSVRDPRIKALMLFGFVIGNIQAATSQALGFFIIDIAQPAAAGTASDGVGALADAPQLIAIALMAGAGATLLAQWGLIRMLRLNPSQLMRWGTALALAGTVGIALARDFHQVVVAFALASLGYGFARPGFTAGSSLAVPRGEQGGVAGAVTSVNGACFIVAPFVGIGLYKIAPTLPYWLGAASLAALAAYAWTSADIRAAGVHVEDELPGDAGAP